MTHLAWVTQGPTMLASVAIDIDITVAFQFVTYALTTFALYFLMVKPYLRVREDRDEGTEGSREEAEEMEARAEQVLTRYEAQLADARRDAMEVRESRRAEGIAEQDDILGKVRAELGDKLEDERARIAGLVASAEADLETRAQELAGLMVKKVLPQGGLG